MWFLKIIFSELFICRQILLSGVFWCSLVRPVVHMNCHTILKAEKSAQSWCLVLLFFFFYPSFSLENDLTISCIIQRSVWVYFRGPFSCLCGDRNESSVHSQFSLSLPFSFSLFYIFCNFINHLAQRAVLHHWCIKPQYLHRKWW